MDSGFIMLETVFKCNSRVISQITAALSFHKPRINVVDVKLQDICIFLLL